MSFFAIRGPWTEVESEALLINASVGMKFETMSERSQRSPKDCLGQLIKLRDQNRWFAVRGVGCERLLQGGLNADLPDDFPVEDEFQQGRENLAEVLDTFHGNRENNPWLHFERIAFIDQLLEGLNSRQIACNHGRSIGSFRETFKDALVSGCIEVRLGGGE